MNDKYQNKYRIASTRLKNWDYGWDGAYFVTICTRDRIHYFGKITNGKMELSGIGRLAEKYWLKIPDHFPFVKLDAFVIMPNHVHGIIIIDKPNDGENTVLVETPKLGVSTSTYANNDTNIKKWKPGNLGVIINQYKRICTIHARKINLVFSWQPRFYDHIIRNNRSFHKIATYIRNNPMKWQDDTFYT